MPCFKKGKSSKTKELDNILQERVEYLEKRIQDLEGKVEEIMEAIKYGRITEQETEEKHDLKNQVEDNKSGLSDSPPEKLNGNDSEMDAHQVDMFEDCEVTVDVHREDIKEGEDVLEQTGKDDSVEETVLGCVEGVNRQEDKLEQIGEAECVEETVQKQVESVNEQEKEIEQIGKTECVEETVLPHVESVNEQENEIEQIGEAECVEEIVLTRVESVNEQEDKLEQIGEDEGVEETVLVHEGLRGEECMESVTQSHQGEYNRRIRFIVICVFLFALGMFLLWGVYVWDVCEWSVLMNNWKIEVKIMLLRWLNPRVVYLFLLSQHYIILLIGFHLMD
jgi:hypothetical protein